jgi:hypothetical protein
MHNPVLPVTADQVHGVNGFRIMISTPVSLAENPQFKPCGCGWSPHLGVHYSNLHKRLGVRKVTAKLAAEIRAEIRKEDR